MDGIILLHRPLLPQFALRDLGDILGQCLRVAGINKTQLFIGGNFVVFCLAFLEAGASQPAFLFR